MVRADKIDDMFIQAIPLCDLHPVGHMADDHLCTCAFIQFIMRIGSFVLIFNEILRIIHFTYIMVKRSRPDQQGVASNLHDHFLGQARYLQAVLKGPRRLFRKGT